MQGVLPGALPEGRLRSAPRRPLSKLQSSKAALGLKLEAGRVCSGAPGLPALPLRPSAQACGL